MKRHEAQSHLTCQFCNKKYDYKSKVVLHQKTCKKKKKIEKKMKKKSKTLPRKKPKKAKQIIPEVIMEDKKSTVVLITPKQTDTTMKFIMS